MCKHCEQLVQKIAEYYLFEPKHGEMSRKMQLGYNSDSHYWFIQDSHDYSIEVKYCPWCGDELEEHVSIKWMVE